MTEIRQVRNETAKFDIVLPDDVPETFVDGTFQTFIGNPYCKILFYSVSASPTDEQMAEGIEVRKVVHQITIPLVSLIDLANSVQTHVAQNLTALQDAFDAIRTNFDAVISGNGSGREGPQSDNDKK